MLIVELLPIILLGVMAGVIAGFIPGVGVFVSLTLAYPWLLQLNGIELLAFYVALGSTTQYIGSISATVFAIPGETSSLPAVKEGHAMFLNGQGGLAISGAAIGSFVGSFLVLGVCFALFPFLENVQFLYNTFLQAIILVCVAILICVATDHPFKSFSLAVVGYFLGLIGCRNIDNQCFATFGDHPDLVGGLPMLPVIIAIYIFPKLLQSSNFDNTNFLDKPIENNFFEHLRYFLDNWVTVVRSTIVGFFAGFTPGVSTTISANLSYTLEKFIQKRKKLYKEGDYRSLVAAETANNAGAFSCLLPLLILGIPIVPSEALLYEIASAKGFIFGETFTLETFKLLAIILVIVNFLALCIAWPFAKHVCWLHKIPVKTLNALIFIALIGVVYMAGAKFYSQEYYLIVLFALLPFGYLLRKYNTLPLIFVFVIQTRLDVIAIRVGDFLQ
jgi:putative tricarboxylic transport membrane protein|tara:strand:- start:401 stop:1735 length:1335 start_codon:yes stop_codon:yes gene_type:complete